MIKSKITGKLILLIVMQICVVLLLPFGFIFASIALMAFDSGYSTEAAIFVSASWVCPILVIVFSIITWLYYRKSNLKITFTSMAIPLIYPVLYFGV